MINRLFTLVSVAVFFASCQETFLGNDPPNTPRENFEHLWKTLDEKYSYFIEKKIDWDDVYKRYSPKVFNSMSNIQLFNVCNDMLFELRDSHVTLIAPFNRAAYVRTYTINYYEDLINITYLKTDYYKTGPLKHALLSSNNIGYIRYASFADDVSDDNIDFVVTRFINTKGIIIDLRNNGGGTLSNMFTICSRFADQTRHVYTSYLKNGTGHNDFAKPNMVYLSPAGKTYKNKVCVLTDRESFSATSFFVLAMRNFPNVTIVGDTTGGGLGAPSGAELPNGWAYQFSASKTLSPDGENLDEGIPPDCTIYLKAIDLQKKLDTIIEKAISIILN